MENYQMGTVEIEGVGLFKIKHNYLHRGQNPRLMTFDKGKYKWLQFDLYDKLETKYFQRGYDTEGNEIKLRIINQ